MKKIKLIMLAAACSFVGSSALHAQATIYDAARLFGNDLNGTARFVGMGGAMGALGGDISTMGTNPAGIGLYRSNDVMVSFGFDNMGTKSTYGDSKNEIDKFFGSFDNAGVVFTYKVGNQTPIRFVNFGFNYRKTKSFNRNMLMNGGFVASQTEQMADMMNSAGIPPSYVEQNGAYSDQDLPWLGILGYDSYLVQPWQHENGEFGGYNPFYQEGDEMDVQYNSRERGGMNSFDFNLSFNLYDRFYFGATLGAYYVDYTRNSTYQEDFFYFNGPTNEWMTRGGYTLDNRYNVTGSGIDFKVGFILRPFESSPFRIGAAVHTPTYFNLTEYGIASIDYDVDVIENGEYRQKKGYTFTQDANGREWQSETPYDIVSPWKYNLSLGYTIGKTVALGAEYEYADYSTTKLKYDDGLLMDGETNDAKNMLKGVHTLRVGAEFKLAPEFAFRVGYNHITAAMKDDAFKFLPSNSVRTDTEYSNLKATNNYTLGFGYRGSSFYADMAYQFNTYKEDFFAFDNKFLEATKLTHNNHKVLFTLGMRF